VEGEMEDTPCPKENKRISKLLRMIQDIERKARMGNITKDEVYRD